MSDEPEIFVHPDEPKRAAFTEKKLPDEPASDVKLELDDGTVLRERVVRSQSNHGYTFRFTHTKLDKEGNVALAGNGEPLLPHSHELCLQGEEAARLGPKGVREAVKREREVAAAKARDFFKGLVEIDKVLAGRV